MEEEGNNNKGKIKIILASASPRRKRILEQLKVDFITIKPSADLEKTLENPIKTALFNSSQKAKFAQSSAIIRSLKHANTVIAGFDTVVFLDGRYLGKPQNTQMAEKYLEFMSGRAHTVITGVTLIDALNGNAVSGHEKTEVKFCRLGRLEIKNYIKTEYVLDKAGAYDIHGFGSLLVERINGCFYNVAGLPVYRLTRLLYRLGYRLL